MVNQLKKLVTATVYKAVANGYDFMELEIEEEEESEDNPRVHTLLDLSGFVRIAVFYALSDVRELKTVEAANNAFPGWTIENLSGSVMADWGWGGWSGDNMPVAPVNVTNSQAGTSWAGVYDIKQEVPVVPVGFFVVGARGGAVEHTGEDEGKLPVSSYLYAENTNADYQQVDFTPNNRIPQGIYV